MKSLFKNIIGAPASTFAAAIIAALGVFIASGIELPEIAIVILMAVAAFLSLFSGPNKPKGSSNIGKLSIATLFLGLLVFALPSCNPTSYVADLSTYGPAIEANPEAVVLKPEDVTPIGGFQTDISVMVDTDHGVVGYDDGTVFTDLVIDLTQGK